LGRGANGGDCFVVVLEVGELSVAVDEEVAGDLGIGAGFEGCEGDGAEAEAAVFHEPAAGVGALEVWDDVGWEVHGKEGGIGNGQVEWLGWGYSPAAPKGISATL
jgi:hypothetical protein|tara:strand:- start:11819 stop:12133 length:315 start_codon:yes stop_codon:yes gene_type:complete